MWGPQLRVWASILKCRGITERFRADSGTYLFKAGEYVVGYIIHFYCFVADTRFYSDVVDCLPLDPAA